MFKIFFLLVLLLFVFYFYRILRVLLQAKKDMENITINRRRDKGQSQSNQDSSKPTYELSSQDYKIEE